MMMNVRVNGTPKPQPRPRAFARGGKARVYDPGTAEAWKSAVASAFQPFAGKAFTEPLHLLITFYLPRPKSHFGTGRNAALLKDTSPVYHTQKPDCDNLAKAVMDCLSDIGFWRDDCQVIGLTVKKMWDTNTKNGPGARIIIHD